MEEAHGDCGVPNELLTKISVQVNKEFKQCRRLMVSSWFLYLLLSSPIQCVEVPFLFPRKTSLKSSFQTLITWMFLGYVSFFFPVDAVCRWSYFVSPVLLQRLFEHCSKQKGEWYEVADKSDLATILSLVQDGLVIRNPNNSLQVKLNI